MNRPNIAQVARTAWRWRVFLVLYALGVGVMLVFTVPCYPGAWIGKIGWALTWPLSGPAFVVEYWVQIDAAVVSSGCPAFIQEMAKGTFR